MNLSFKKLAILQPEGQLDKLKAITAQVGIEFVSGLGRFDIVPFKLFKAQLKTF
ncbi:MAG: hypothetical protein LBC61_07390 [Candidatus Peribacteria bacterium]|jgi:hypothetical protein|nr:hypothetical protein [Candidatus Peribacteria bacterium]